MADFYISVMMINSFSFVTYETKMHKKKKVFYKYTIFFHKIVKEEPIANQITKINSANDAKPMTFPGARCR